MNKVSICNGVIGQLFPYAFSLIFPVFLLLYAVVFTLISISTCGFFAFN